MGAPALDQKRTRKFGTFAGRQDFALENEKSIDTRGPDFLKSVDILVDKGYSEEDALKVLYLKRGDLRAALASLQVLNVIEKDRTRGNTSPERSVQAEKSPESISTTVGNLVFLL